MEGVETPEAMPLMEEGFVQHLNDPPDLAIGSGGMTDLPPRQPEQEIVSQQPGEENIVEHMGGTMEDNVALEAYLI
ncbi:hypothetical protein K2173_005804 [Erythroxylum novogranatense]|uniref:Uncharacterized protein n=1 Tax=Erythroxylum novogranatense TaxID=1862640 RepID=A0AAV8U5H9_9ROSI|nr:hypothetical protein K2173_005804 [Erythroxylum novogranatense]